MLSSRDRPYDDTIFSTLERIEAMQGAPADLLDLASLVSDFQRAREQIPNLLEQIRQLRSDLIGLQSELDIARDDLDDARSQLAETAGRIYDLEGPSGRVGDPQ